MLGYQVMYTSTAVEDLDEWQWRAESVELQGLERLAEYAVVVAARTRDGLLVALFVLRRRRGPTKAPEGVCQRTYLDLSYQPFWRVGHVVVLDLSYYFSLSGPTLNLSYSQLTACRTIPIRGHVLRFR